MHIQRRHGLYKREPIEEQSAETVDGDGGCLFGRSHPSLAFEIIQDNYKTYKG
jgi:hypothetical protein